MYSQMRKAKALLLMEALLYAMSLYGSIEKRRPGSGLEDFEAAAMLKLSRTGSGQCVHGKTPEELQYDTFSAIMKEK